MVKPGNAAAVAKDLGWEFTGFETGHINSSSVVCTMLRYMVPKAPVEGGRIETTRKQANAEQYGADAPKSVRESFFTLPDFQSMAAKRKKNDADGESLSAEDRIVQTYAIAEMKVQESQEKTAVPTKYTALEAAAEKAMRGAVAKEDFAAAGEQQRAAKQAAVNLALETGQVVKKWEKRRLHRAAFERRPRRGRGKKAGLTAAAAAAADSAGEDEQAAADVPPTALAASAAGKVELAAAVAVEGDAKMAPSIAAAAVGCKKTVLAIAKTAPRAPNAKDEVSELLDRLKNPPAGVAAAAADNDDEPMDGEGSDGELSDGEGLGGGGSNGDLGLAGDLDDEAMGEDEDLERNKKRKRDCDDDDDYEAMGGGGQCGDLEDEGAHAIAEPPAAVKNSVEPPLLVRIAALKKQIAEKIAAKHAAKVAAKA